jgi:hypothetical protein
MVRPSVVIAATGNPKFRSLKKLVELAWIAMVVRYPTGWRRLQDW